ncbi:MAG TPA: A24 family peptidase [Propionibacteriaceae bacterium]
MNPAVIAALVTAAAVAGLVRPVLLRLPEPVDTEDKKPYAALPTPGFVAGCALLAGLGVAVAGLTLTWSIQPLWWVLSSFGVLLAGIDARTTWLPLVVTRWAWLAMAVGALGSLALGAGGWVLFRVSAGAAVAGLLYLLFWLASRGGFGFGDVRFAPLIGAAASADSWSLLLWALVLGTLVGGLHGLVRLVRGRRDSFPYAPAMLVGAYLACVLVSGLG